MGKKQDRKLPSSATRALGALLCFLSVKSWSPCPWNSEKKTPPCH